MKRLSLLEILAWLLPLGVALAVGLYIYQTRPSEEIARLARARDALRAINAALLAPRPQDQAMPDSAAGLQALVDDGTLPKLPLDPWGHPYQYRQPGREHVYELYSLGPDGVESQDDVVAWNLYGGR